ncbi:MAG: SLBB domain-containing protein [Planctomycetaceae bacterium]
MRHGRLSILLYLAILAAGASLHGAHEGVQLALAEATRQVEPRQMAGPGFYFGILGQVAKPAVYQFRTATVRLTDLVSAAGGVTDRATGNARVFRRGLNRQQALIMPGADVRLMAGDIVVFDERQAANTGVVLSDYSPGVSSPAGFEQNQNAQSSRIQVAFVGLIERPVIVKMPSEHATVPKLLALLQQKPDVAHAVRVIQTGPAAAVSPETSGDKIQLTSGSIVVFDRDLIVADCVRESLPAAIDVAAPSGVASAPSADTSGTISALPNHAGAAVDATTVSFPSTNAVNEPVAESSQSSTGLSEPATWSADALSSQTTGGNEAATDSAHRNPLAVTNQPITNFDERNPTGISPGEVSIEIQADGANNAATYGHGAGNEFDPFPPIPYDFGNDQSSESAGQSSAEQQSEARADAMSMLPSRDFHPSQRATDLDAQSTPAKKARGKQDKRSWFERLGIPMDLTIVGILGTLAAVVALGILGHTTHQPVPKPVKPPTPTEPEVPVPVQQPKNEFRALECLIKNQLPIVEEPCQYKPNVTFFGRAAVAGQTRRVDSAHNAPKPPAPARVEPKREISAHDRAAIAKAPARGSRARASHSSPPVAEAGRSDLLERVLSNIHGPGAL